LELCSASGLETAATPAAYSAGVGPAPPAFHGGDPIDGHEAVLPAVVR